MYGYLLRNFSGYYGWYFDIEVVCVYDKGRLDFNSLGYFSKPSFANDGFGFSVYFENSFYLVLCRGLGYKFVIEFVNSTNKSCFGGRSLNSFH